LFKIVLLISFCFFELKVQSVHFLDTFDDGGEMNNSSSEMIDIVPTKTVDQVVDLINSTKKRNLTDWCFAEHYEANVLVQVLQKAYYTHPYIDTYYNRRDNSLMLVLSNPHEDNLTNNQEWNIKLHSNVGFRFVRNLINTF
jgi:hypothetical protein